MNPKNFLNAVQDIFKPEVERENAELQRLEKARQDRLFRQGIISKVAILKDKVTTAIANHDAALSHVERLANWPVQSLYDTFAEGGLTDVQLAERLAQIEATFKHLPEIKKSLWAKIVLPHEKALALFEKEHAAILKGVKLEQVDTPPFVPTALDFDHYGNGQSSKLVRDGLGLTN
jgi:hypothetical protein